MYLKFVILDLFYFQQYHRAPSIEHQPEGVKLIEAIVGDIEGIGGIDLFNDIQLFLYSILEYQPYTILRNDQIIFYYMWYRYGESRC